MSYNLPIAKERGPVYWKIHYTGIRGGAIRLYIVKNRLSFNKTIIFNDSESFETAIKICQDKVMRVIHIKNHVNPNLARLANYCIDATSVEETKEDFI